MKLAELNWRQAGPRLSDPSTVVVIPIGSTEQHGPLGPLGTDWIVPEWIVNEMEKKVDILATPVIPFGVATHHASFPGTIDIGLEALLSVMRGVFSSLARHGARRFIVVNGHGGNDPAITTAALEVSRRFGALIAELNWWSIAPQLNPTWTTGHGDAQEVSAIMHIRPDLVKVEDCPQTTANNPLSEMPLTHLSQVAYKGARVTFIRDIRLSIPQGGFGGITSEKATKEWGDAMMPAIVDYCASFAADFRHIDLPAPYAQALA